VTDSPISLSSEQSEATFVPTAGATNRSSWQQNRSLLQRSSKQAQPESGFSRRDALKTAVFAAAAVALPVQRVVRARAAYPGRMAESSLPAPFTVPFGIPPVAKTIATDATTDHYHFEMKSASLEILPGFRTPMYTYQDAALNPSFPGPTIMVQQGRQVRVRQCNELPSLHATLGYEPWTSVHLHGSPSLPQYDGYTSDITRPGQYKDYFYPNTQPARTLWYHDHGLHHTAENVYQGLAAQYILMDPREQSLPIPHGEFDVPLVISDAMFKSNGELLFPLDNESGMYGDVILANGKPWPIMKVQPRKYRFRVLNASVSRSYFFSLSDSNATMWMIGTDAGLAPTAQKIKGWRHGMAERYEIVIDFSGCAGKKVTMKNTSPKNNTTFTNTDKVMMFDVQPTYSGPTADNSLTILQGEPLSTTNQTMELQPSQAVQTRQMRLVREGGKWTVNGTTWDKVVASGYQFAEAKPVRGSVEIWEIINDSGGWFHPFHIHLIDFKILDRNGRPPNPWELGPKDVVYVGENEKVRVIARFEGLGRYMMHCHNLIHEDHDMMSQFEVVDSAGVGDDPLSAPCKSLPETN
jgi:spore coat protein A, manganese oxidase